MIGISKKVENAVISVLSAQTELESIEVIRGKEAVTHATFPRIVVDCSKAKPLMPGQVQPLQAKLEITVQTEAKVDTDFEVCEDIANAASSPLLPPNGVNNANAVGSEVHFYKMDFHTIEEPEEVEGIVEAELIASLYIS
jgi:hypothetical protein